MSEREEQHRATGQRANGDQGGERPMGRVARQRVPKQMLSGLRPPCAPLATW